MTTKLPITAFEFTQIMRSHGWFDLAPFVVVEQDKILEYAYDIPEGSGAIRIASDAAGDVIVAPLVGDADLAVLVARRVLSLDIDIAPLHEAVRGTEFSWIATESYGRYLRGATLFENAFKIVMTTIITWPQAKGIISKAVALYGKKVDGKTLQAFPAPEAFAGLEKTEIMEDLRCGLRAKTVLALCARAKENPDVLLGDAWQKMTDVEFHDALLGMEGLGDMCRSYLCRFYGKAGKPSLDSWVEKPCKVIFGVKADKAAFKAFFKKRYARFGKHAASICWFDITRYWHDGRQMTGDWSQLPG